MGKVILIIIGLIIATIGVICIFDARVITKKDVWLWRPKRRLDRAKNIRLFSVNNRCLNHIL